MPTLGELIKRALQSVASGRCYPGLAPDGITGAYLTYQHEGPPQTAVLGGQPSLQNQIVQIDSWADSYLVAERNARAAFAIMVTESHETSPTMFSATCVNYGYFGPDPDTKKERVSMEFSVWYFAS